MDFLCEHVVDRKKEGAYKFKKAFIISLWIIIPFLLIVAGFAIGSLDGPFVVFRFTVILTPLFVWLGLKIGPITAAYGDEAFEYSIASAEMSFAKVYGNRFRKEWFKFSLPKAEIVAPYDKNDLSVENRRYAHVYVAVSSKNAPYIYYCVFKNDKDEECIVYFEVIKKSLKMIKTYAPRTVMTDLPY